MRRWLKRLRGALGIGLTWAAIWFAVGTIVGLVLFGRTVNVELFVNARAYAYMGFVGGAIFSTALGIAEGRRTFDEMSLRSFAVLGAVGGLFVSMLLGAGFVVFALLGAGSAAGSLAVARRADSLLESGDDVGLLEGETPEALD